jgi:hypothetical protein
MLQLFIFRVVFEFFDLGPDNLQPVRKVVGGKLPCFSIEICLVVERAAVKELQMIISIRIMYTRNVTYYQERVFKYKIRNKFVVEETEAKWGIGGVNGVFAAEKVTKKLDKVRVAEWLVNFALRHKLACCEQ